MTERKELRWCGAGTLPVAGKPAKPASGRQVAHHTLRQDNNRVATIGVRQLHHPSGPPPLSDTVTGPTRSRRDLTKPLFWGGLVAPRVRRLLALLKHPKGMALLQVPRQTTGNGLVTHLIFVSLPLGIGESGAGATGGMQAWLCLHCSTRLRVPNSTAATCQLRQQLLSRSGPGRRASQ